MCGPDAAGGVHYCVSTAEGGVCKGPLTVGEMGYSYVIANVDIEHFIEAL